MYMGLYASEVIYIVTPILSPTLHVNHDDRDDPDLYRQHCGLIIHYL